MAPATRRARSLMPFCRYPARTAPPGGHSPAEGRTLENGKSVDQLAARSGDLPQRRGEDRESARTRERRRETRTLPGFTLSRFRDPLQTPSPEKNNWQNSKSATQIPARRTRIAVAQILSGKEVPARQETAVQGPRKGAEREFTPYFRVPFRVVGRFAAAHVGGFPRHGAGRYNGPEGRRD
jgi:hypothetical protein